MLELLFLSTVYMQRGEEPPVGRGDGGERQVAMLAKQVSR